MAYAAKSTGSWCGPYPNKAGEFCGNVSLSHVTLDADGSTITNICKVATTNKRIGQPAACQAGSSEEMVKKGCVGLYLIKDRPLMSFERGIDTDRGGCQRAKACC